MGGFKSDSKSWLSKEQNVLQKAEKLIGNAILNRGTILAPVLSGALVKSGRVEKNQSGGISVIFGGGNVRYARRRHEENRKTPQTLHYLKRAGDSTAKENIKKYVDMSR